jgi:hypothetical protein
LDRLGIALSWVTRCYIQVRPHAGVLGGLAVTVILMVLIGLEGAHAWYESIFGRMERVGVSELPKPGDVRGSRIQKGAQGRDRTTDTRIFSLS